jgi:hypothetical protein
VLELRGQGLRALLAYRLALARGERGQEIVEGGVARIVPVELLVGALEEVAGSEPVPLVFAQEGDVQP